MNYNEGMENSPSSKIPTKITAENYESIRRRIENLVRIKYDVPILNAENIDTVLNTGPYLSHSLVVDDGQFLSILEDGSLLSSETAERASMTYESDKLMDMDKNVFLGLGKAYMKRSRFAFLFDPNKVSTLDGATFVENDLMDKGAEVITDFLDKHKNEMVEIIRKKKDHLNKIFTLKVTRMFQGGYGIYSEYFDNPKKDRVEDLLKELETSSFRAISTKSEVIQQFTILRDSILGEDIMPSNLRDELRMELKEKVVEPNTKTGRENISLEIERTWDLDSNFYNDFLPQSRRVPEKVTEIRIPSKLDLKDALMAVFVPNVEDLTNTS